MEIKPLRALAEASKDYINQAAKNLGLEAARDTATLFLADWLVGSSMLAAQRGTEVGSLTTEPMAMLPLVGMATELGRQLIHLRDAHKSTGSEDLSPKNTKEWLSRVAIGGLRGLGTAALLRYGPDIIRLIPWGQVAAAAGGLTATAAVGYFGYRFATEIAWPHIKRFGKGAWETGGRAVDAALIAPAIIAKTEPGNLAPWQTRVLERIKKDTNLEQLLNYLNTALQPSGPTPPTP